MLKVINMYTNEITTVYHIISTNYGVQFLVYDPKEGWHYRYADNYKPIKGDSNE